MIQTLTEISELRPACQTALNLTGRPYLSWSQISTFLSCPRKFAYSYVERAQPEFVPSSLKFGGAIHAGLECFLCARMEGISIELADLMDAYAQDWESVDAARKGLPIRFNRDEDPRSLSDLAARMFRAFLASPLADAGGTMLAIEESFTGVLADDLPDVLARVDLIEQRGRVARLIDFKTSRSRWSAQKAMEGAGQLLLYRHLAGDLLNDLHLPVSLSFAVLTKSKNPVVQELDVPDQAPGSLDNTLESIRQVWTAMQGGACYPVPSPLNCTTCAFRGRCPAHRGVASVTRP